MLPQETYKRFAVITLYIAVGIAVIYIIFGYLWSAILPFLIAYIFAECFRPVVRYSERNEKFPKRSFVLFVVLLSALSVSLLVYSLGRQIFLEMSEFLSSAKSMIAKIRLDDSYAAEIIDKINSMIPFVDLRERLWEMRENLDEELWAIIVSLSETALGSFLSLLGNMAAFLPNMLLTFAVIIIATYYFAIDRVAINCFLLSLFPKKFRPILKNAKDILSNTVGKYLRAYALLFLITFIELLVSFMLLGVDFAFILALLTALIDVLPVLGTGTILIPWGLASIFLGNYGRGLGLLITYAIITVVRQILEPKIIGKFIGISPLATLASMYIGLKLMGIAGLFLFPIVAIVIKRIVEDREKQNS